MSVLRGKVDGSRWYAATLAALGRGGGGAGLAGYGLGRRKRRRKPRRRVDTGLPRAVLARNQGTSRTPPTPPPRPARGGPGVVPGGGLVPVIVGARRPGRPSAGPGGRLPNIPPRGGRRAPRLPLPGLVPSFPGPRTAGGGVPGTRHPGGPGVPGPGTIPGEQVPGLTPIVNPRDSKYGDHFASTNVFSAAVPPAAGASVAAASNAPTPSVPPSGGMGGMSRLHGAGSWMC